LHTVVSGSNQGASPRVLQRHRLRQSRQGRSVSTQGSARDDAVAARRHAELPHEPAREMTRS
jgi:hypothetical protein